ncbi:MAG: polyprenyl synthetase family protein, partial [Saezia sp.]
MLKDASTMNESFDIDVWIGTRLGSIEKALTVFIQDNVSLELAQAMRYAVLDGGKRLRPLLVLATAQAVGVKDCDASMRAACAVELIHAYSLVHDDMPCMDNDVLRRGKPTVHVQYGEAIAMLAGDALQALAFEVLTTDDAAVMPYEIQARLVNLLSRAAGTAGMAGGQAIDLLSVGKSLDEERLKKMHLFKTGALLECCIAMGIACQQSKVEERTKIALMNYASYVGLAFQVVDDILDVTALSDVIGKTAGKDAHADKPTYVSVLGLETAQSYAQGLYEKAMQALEGSGLKDV